MTSSLIRCVEEVEMARSEVGTRHPAARRMIGSFIQLAVTYMFFSQTWIVLSGGDLSNNFR
eukprot:scaffold5862_cov91-Skeletonema_marinoi.AAC.5